MNPYEMETSSPNAGKRDISQSNSKYKPPVNKNPSKPPFNPYNPGSIISGKVKNYSQNNQNSQHKNPNNKSNPSLEQYKNLYDKKINQLSNNSHDFNKSSPNKLYDQTSHSQGYYS